MLFGLAGCAILAYAVIGGVRVVEEALHGFLPVLPQLPFISISDSPPEWPNLGTTTSLGSMGYQQWRNGQLSGPGDQHAYTFVGHAGDTVLIEAAAVDGVLNPALALYGVDGVLIEVNMDIDPSNLNARLSSHLTAEGTYTILVVAEAAQGGYQLTLRSN